VPNRLVSAIFYFTTFHLCSLNTSIVIVRIFTTIFPILVRILFTVAHILKEVRKIQYHVWKSLTFPSEQVHFNLHFQTQFSGADFKHSTVQSWVFCNISIKISYLFFLPHEFCVPTHTSCLLNHPTNLRQRSSSLSNFVHHILPHVFVISLSLLSMYLLPPTCRKVSEEIFRTFRLTAFSLGFRHKISWSCWYWRW
jgi:hypothetical protein